MQRTALVYVGGLMRKGEWLAHRGTHTVTLRAALEKVPSAGGAAAATATAVACPVCPAASDDDEEAEELL